MRTPIDLTGQRFGRLVTLTHVFKVGWRCACDCGGVTNVTGTSLRRGTTRSCGCLNSELAATRKRTHGMTGSPEYRSWFSAKMRCTNPSNNRWADYGGRGVRMCDEWLNDFPAFVAHIGPRPSLQHTLDRIDVNGHYEPGNVRWATRKQQANNCRSNVRLTFRGETKPLQEWADLLGMRATMIALRISRYGWSVERALTQPTVPLGSPRCPRPTNVRTVCKRGHPRTPENLYPGGTCRLCHKMLKAASAHV